MVRNVVPEAITLAIGDGANDVNMITQAHVGIGIEGLEGMQAARASDYAIAQFKYLRPLLFYHGREAYRRNAILAIYMFYKNNLFVIPQYWFGFASAFSGQTLYEALIYQGYNIVFTALPILWFAIFDEEFSKQTFLNEPKHFWIGLYDEYYSFKLLTLSVIKGIINGLLIFLFVFCSIDGLHVGAEGKNGSFWVSSATVYAIVVINANLWILQRTCTHTWVSTVLIFLSIASYFLFWWLENLFPFSTSMYRIFNKSMSEGRVYLVIILNAWQAVALDLLVARWADLRSGKREKLLLRQEIQSGQNMDGLKNSLTQSLREVDSMIAPHSLIDRSGQLTPVEALRRSQSEQMDVEKMASSMGEMNPLLERRGTFGYAFSQDVKTEERANKKAAHLAKPSPPVTPLEKSAKKLL